MVKKNTSDEDFDAWRIGQKFTVVKFLQPLKDFNDAAKQAKYGIVAGALPMSDLNHPVNMVGNRIAGIDKMHFILNMLTYDIYFSLDKHAKNALVGIKSRLAIVEDNLLKETFVDVRADRVNHINTKAIKEDMFRILFSTLLDLNSKMLDMMNQAGLIFRKNEEFDLDAFMADIVHRG